MFLFSNSFAPIMIGAVIGAVIAIVYVYYNRKKGQK